MYSVLSKWWSAGQMPVITPEANQSFFEHTNVQYNTSSTWEFLFTCVIGQWTIWLREKWVFGAAGIPKPMFVCKDNYWELYMYLLSKHHPKPIVKLLYWNKLRLAWQPSCFLPGDCVNIVLDVKGAKPRRPHHFLPITCTISFLQKR